MTAEDPQAEEFARAVRQAKKKNQLHPMAEARLADLLKRLYPQACPMPEVAAVPGGRNDLIQFFPNGRRVVFELFATPSQVPQDLRLLEQVPAGVKVAILLDQSINSKLSREYFHKKPDHFPFLWLSQLLQPELEAECVRHLRDVIEAPPARQPAGGESPTRALSRSAALEDLERFSKACCRELWEAAGVPPEAAVAMAAEPSVGAPKPEMHPNPERPVFVLAAEIGSGKSLIAHRLLQKAIANALADATAPIPVFLAARNAIEHLRDAVEEAAKEIGNPRQSGAYVVVDGADEVGTQAASSLVSEAKILTAAWPPSTTSIVITSRPVGDLLSQFERETELVPPLTPQEAWALVGHISGQDAAVRPDRWSDSLRDAIRRPLYAILLGSYLRDKPGSMSSLGKLLAHLVEVSLRRNPTFSADVNDMLQRLAVTSNAREGAAVPLSEIAPNRSAAKPLLDSRLVAERADGLVSPLAILREWFAAQSLAAGKPPVQEILEDPLQVENWRYSFVIALSTFNHELASKIIGPLAETNPAVASEIIHDALKYWDSSNAPRPPPRTECARRIREAMVAWVKGIGLLAEHIAPVLPDGTVPPIGVELTNGYLCTSWYHGHTPQGLVMDLPEKAPGQSDRDYHRDWPSFQSARPGRLSAWAWQSTLEELVSALSRLVKAHRLPVDLGPILHELAWPQLVALSLRGLSRQDLRGVPWPTVIPISKIEEALADKSLTGLCHFLTGECHIEGMRLYVAQCRERGISEFRGLPEGDIPFPGPYDSWAGANFSDSQLLDRAHIVFRDVLESHTHLVETWFPRFAPRLSLYAQLPVRLTGVAIPSPRTRTPDPPPRIPLTSWHMEPLPRHARSVVEFRIGKREEWVLDRNLLKPLEAQLRTLRPEARRWIFPWAYKGELPIFSSFPVRKLTYKWLEDDLRRISWLS